MKYRVTNACKARQHKERLMPIIFTLATSIFKLDRLLLTVQTQKTNTVS